MTLIILFKEDITVIISYVPERKHLNNLKKIAINEHFNKNLYYKMNLIKP